MTKSRLRFSEFLTPCPRPVLLAADQDADLVGVRWYGEGPFHREYKKAHDIRKKSHFLLRAGDITFNKLFAWKGAFGIVPNELDGMYVSDKFPTYKLDAERILPAYLRWFFKHSDVWGQAKRKSTGSAAISKLTLNPPRFLELSIPVRSLKQQAKVAGQLDEIERRVREARAMCASVFKESSILRAAVAKSVLGECVVSGTLGETLLDLPRNGWSPKCDDGPDGVPVLTLSAVTGWEYDATAIKRTSLPTQPQAKYWLQEGDLLITRSNTPELVGHAAIYSGLPERCIYPDLVMRLRVNESRYSKRFVWWWLQAPIVREYIRTNAKGSSPTMKKISQGIVAAIPFPTQISLGQQERLAARLDALNRDILLARSAAEGAVSDIEPLIPAILHKVFDDQTSLSGES